MTKDEHYTKAKELIEKQPDKGRSYIRGSLAVKKDGELSEKLRALLNGKGHGKKAKTKEPRKKESTGAKTKGRTRGDVADTRGHGGKTKTKTTRSVAKKTAKGAKSRRSTSRNPTDDVPVR